MLLTPAGGEFIEREGSFVLEPGQNSRPASEEEWIGRAPRMIFRVLLITPRLHEQFA